MQPAFDRQHAEQSLVEILDGLGGDRVVGLGFRLLDDVLATACHCLPRIHGRLVLPDPDQPSPGAVVARVRRPGTPGVTYAAVLAVDTCSDLALLGAPPAGATLPDAPSPLVTIEALLARLAPVRLQLAPPREGLVFVFTHERRWIEGYAVGSAIAIMRPSDKIRSGTSGAPVFDVDGRVVGLVGHNDVRLPDATLCALGERLPGWALRRAGQAAAARGAAAPPAH